MTLKIDIGQNWAFLKHNLRVCSLHEKGLVKLVRYKQISISKSWLLLKGHPFPQINGALVLCSGAHVGETGEGAARPLAEKHGPANR